MDIDDKKRDFINKICAECGEKIYPHEVATIYDGEWCHIDCAADAMDNDFFDI